MEVTCFYEELGLRGFDRVVSEESATLDGFISMGVYANYMNIVKFASEYNISFIRLLEELLR